MVANVRNSFNFEHSIGRPTNMKDLFPKYLDLFWQSYEIVWIIIQKRYPQTAYGVQNRCISIYGKIFKINKAMIYKHSFHLEIYRAYFIIER